MQRTKFLIIWIEKKKLFAGSSKQIIFMFPYSKLSECQDVLQYVVLLYTSKTRWRRVPKQMSLTYPNHLNQRSSGRTHASCRHGCCRRREYSAPSTDVWYYRTCGFTVIISFCWWRDDCASEADFWNYGTSDEAVITGAATDCTRVSTMGFNHLVNQLLF